MDEALKSYPAPQLYQYNCNINIAISIQLQHQYCNINTIDISIQLIVGQNNRAANYKTYKICKENPSEDLFNTETNPRTGNMMQCSSI